VVLWVLLGFFGFFVLELPLSAQTIQNWVRAGANLPEANRYYLEQKKGEENFTNFVHSLPPKEKARVTILYREAGGRWTLKQQKVVEFAKPLKIEKQESKSTEWVLGGNTIDRSFSQSSNLISAGGKVWDQRFLFESKDKSPTYSYDLGMGNVRIMGGNRFKPLPHFYFSKDPDFYSAFDRFGSYWTQPILESHYLQYTKSSQLSFGFFTARSVTQNPGIFINLGKDRVSFAWDGQFGSLYWNESRTGEFWKLRSQGEVFGTAKRELGFGYFIYSLVHIPISFETTMYRDPSQTLRPNNEKEMVSSQLLQYVRIRGWDYFVFEGIRSYEGLVGKEGMGIWIPIVSTSFGSPVIRYRIYREVWQEITKEIGRGLFWEWRQNGQVISIGGESISSGFQPEARISFRIPKAGIFETSALFTTPRRQTDAWFENWTYAMDFNIDLTDRLTIYKCKWSSDWLSINLSFTRRRPEDPLQYWVNLQGNLIF